MVRHYLRKLRHAWCVLWGGHLHFHPIAHTDAMISYCSRCGHVAVIDLSDRPKLRRIA